MVANRSEVGIDALADAQPHRVQLLAEYGGWAIAHECPHHCGQPVFGCGIVVSPVKPEICLSGDASGSG